MEDKDKNIPSPLSGITVWCVRTMNIRNNNTIGIAVFTRMEAANAYAQKQQGYTQAALVEETAIDFPLSE